MMRAYSQILFRVIFMPLLFYCPNYFPISLLQDYIVTQVETGMPEYELIDRDELVSILVLFVPIGSVFFAHSFSKLRNSKHTVREFERQFTENQPKLHPRSFIKNLQIMPLFKTITEERKQRLQSRLSPDPVAWTLWERALINCNSNSRQRLTGMYLLASQINYSHDSIPSEVYFAHPLRVAALSYIYSNDTDAAIVGLLHNVFEVCADDISFLQKKLNQKF